MSVWFAKLMCQVGRHARSMVLACYVYVVVAICSYAFAHQREYHMVHSSWLYGRSGTRDFRGVIIISEFAFNLHASISNVMCIRRPHTHTHTLKHIGVAKDVCYGVSRRVDPQEDAWRQS